MTRAGGAAGIGLIAIVGIGWGLLAPASKVLFAADPAAFDGVTVAVARAVWALPLFLLSAGAAWLLERPRLAPRAWAAIAGAALLFGPGITVSYSSAAQLTSIAHISFLIGFSPVTNSLAAALAFRLPIGRRQQLALALGVVGVALLAAQHSAGESARGGLIGDALMIGWLLAFAGYAILLRAVGSGVSATFVMGAVGSLAMGFIVLGALAIPGALRGAEHVTESRPVAAWFFGEIVLGSALLAQTSYAEAVKRYGVAFATIGAEYTALAVGIAASFAARETWSWLTVAGGVALVLALAVTFAPRRA